MKFFDVLLGRTKPARPNLDVLFAFPAAATTLQAALGLRVTGAGAVCFRTAQGAAAERKKAEALDLLRFGGGGDAEFTRDDYAHTWATYRRPDADLAALVSDLHAVNVTLAEAGFGTGLLCTAVGFATSEEQYVGLVYLFKRGTVYPFAPLDADTRRDNTLELAIRAQLDGDMPVEPDLGRWFPLWSAPPLR